MDLNTIPGLAELVAKDLERIDGDGIRDAVEAIL